MRISDWSSDVCSSDLQRALFVRNGDVFVRELGAGVLRQLTASAETEADPQFSADQQAALWRVGHDWYRLTFSAGVARAVARSDKRHGGKECVSTCRSRWAPFPYKKKNNTDTYR